MAASNQIQNALLTEHFRYTPLTLLDDIINTVNELVFRAINAIDEGLSSAPPHALGFRLPPDHPLASLPADDENKTAALADLKQNEIDNGIVQLESLLNATVDKDFDKFEIYTLRNILAVGHGEEEARDLASWVQLEHYRHLDLHSQASTNPAGEGSAPALTPEEIQLQRRKLQESRKLHTLLQAEEARNTALLTQLHHLTGTAAAASLPPSGNTTRPGADTDNANNPTPTASPFAFLTSTPHLATSSPSHHPLTETLQYTLTHLPLLRAHLAQLRTALDLLPNARYARGNNDDDDEDGEAGGGREAKRRRYLDVQARGAMDRRGVVVGEEEEGVGGAGTGGSWAGREGRRVGREEVEGLEGVVLGLEGVGAEAGPEEGGGGGRG